MSIDKDSGLSQAELDALKDDEDDTGTGNDDGADDGDDGQDDDDGADDGADDGGDDSAGDDDGQGDGAGDDADGGDGDDGTGAGAGDDDAGAGDGDAGTDTRRSSDKTREAHDMAREEAAKAKLTEIDGQIAVLDQKFEDGDITGKEYREAQRKLNEERDAQREVLTEVKVSRQLREERAREAWEEAQDRFFGAAENQRFVKNNILFKALNDEVISIARSPEAAGKNGDWVLAEAKKRVEEAFGAAPAAAPDKQDKQGGKDKPARPQRPAKLPPDIGSLPAAGGESPQDGRFAHLDKLEGVALEEAVAKMSAADQEAWARS